MASIMKEFEASSQLNGSNAPYVEEQYERYLADPSAVDASWRATFDAWQKDSPAKKDVPHSPVIAAFENLARNPQRRARPRPRPRATRRTSRCSSTSARTACWARATRSSIR
jgi:2-oxoglutarate dehydrogenase complex dehydrogenase (E1) component-like enzyme